MSSTAPSSARAPRISVVMPTMGRPRLLRRAVAAILRQDWPEWELLVMEFAPDALSAIQCDDRVRHLRVDRPGITYAFNRGLERATGDIFNASYDDDRMLPGAMRVAIERLASAEWCYGAVLVEDGSGNRLGMRGRIPYDHRYQLMVANQVPAPAAFWRRSALEVVGLWDERPEIDLAADYDYWCRLGSRWLPATHPEPLAIWTDHPGSITVARPGDQEQAAAAVRRKYRSAAGQPDQDRTGRNTTS
jgi:glycosyltransferase involved in cell wall biosynthesis